jgi:CubicO group peptidase (beta-lactamase class C family)
LPTVVQILEGQPPSNVRRLFMERAPGTLMEYSGGGVTLMQLALSDARKRPFADVLRDDVLRPIGMVNSTYEQPLPPARDRNAARAHDGEGKSRGAKWHVYPELAAAGLWTTSSDLARFAIEVQKTAAGTSNRVLSRASVLEMLTPVGVGDFAVGFTIDKVGQGWYFSHGGSNWGFQCLMRAHRSKGYGFAIMTNADRGGALAAELGKRIQRAYEWDSFAEPAPRGYAPPPARADITLPRDVLAQYVGVYESPQLTFTISLEDGFLHMTPSGQSKVRLYAAARDTLFPRVVNATFVMTRDTTGKVAGLLLRQGGPDLAARKVR